MEEGPGEHLVEINLVPAALMSTFDIADHDDRSVSSSGIQTPARAPPTSRSPRTHVFEEDLMRTKLLALTAAAAIVAGSAVAAPAQAATAQDCETLIGRLRTATNDATSLGKSGPPLVDKLDSAALKLGENKIGDALQKLVDYDTTLDALHAAPKPKVSEADYASLDSGIADAIACVEGLGGS
jgi:hypothetical protein